MLTNKVCSFNDDFSFNKFNIEIKDGTQIDMNDWFFDVWGTPNNLNLVKPVKQHNSFYVALQEKAKELNLNLFEHDKHYVVSSKTCEQWKYDLMSADEKQAHDSKKYFDGLRAERMNLKAELNSTDWIVVKIQEQTIACADVDENELLDKYSVQLNERNKARKRINEIEKELTDANESFEIVFE